MEKLPLIDFTKVKKKRFNNTPNEEKSAADSKANQAENSNYDSLLNKAKNESSQPDQPTTSPDAADYDLLLERIYRLMKENNPDSFKDSKLTMSHPNLVRAGTRSVWTNFDECCKSLNRTNDHLYTFFVKELGVEASLGGDNQLFLKGRHNATKIEQLLAKYAKEYIRCENCRSTDTYLHKDNSTRLQIMICNRCKSNRTVAQIKK